MVTHFPVVHARENWSGFFENLLGVIPAMHRPDMVSSDPSHPTEAARRETAARLIAGADHISTSPPLAFQILNFGRKGTAPLDGLINLVRLDPELTAQILRVCNSAEVRGNKVSSLQEATLRLGTTAIASRAMTLTLGRMLDVPRTAYCPDPNSLWRHSVQTGLVARRLAPACRFAPDGEAAFTAGLLHDLGKMVINCGATEEVDRIVAMRREKQLASADAELEVLGADHAEIGGLILERWNLPEPVVNGVRYHHTPDFDGTGMARLVHVAEACSKVTTAEDSWSRFDGAIHPFVLDELGLTITQIEECWQGVIRYTKVVEAYLG